MADESGIGFILRNHPKQQLQVETARSGAAHVDRAEIRRFLDELEWPLAYFDIETTSSAIPYQLVLVKSPHSSFSLHGG